MRKVCLLTFCSGVLALSSMLEQTAQAQGNRNRMRDSERRIHTEPLLGVTTNGEVIPDLFSIRSSGVSTEPVLAAAKAFLAGLDEAQRAKTTFPVGDVEWRKWNNVHFYV